MARIFIIHSSANNDRAIQLRDCLVANGWDDIFLDLDPERGIAAGERWKEALARGHGEPCRDCGRMALGAEQHDTLTPILAEFPLRFMASALRVLQPAWHGARSLLRS